MLQWLWLIPAFPLAGFLFLALLGSRLPRPILSLVGAGSVGLSAVTTFLIALEFFPHCHAFQQTLWTWFSVGDLKPGFGLYLDSLSLLMTGVVTFIGFLIHLYATEYMAHDKDYARFFAYMNLFVASMLALVLADNMVLLYLGWEGVGLCSYLLIGFWYQDPYNVRCANKAFIVTRIGDTGMAIALFLLVLHFGTLDIQKVMQMAGDQWVVGSTLATIVALCLLAGAIGKSGQLPLQVWLPDAMAGPTPVSALLHSSTMVTAGVYLIARTNGLFTIAPQAQWAVAVVGALTLFMAGFAALCQSDIKRALAYSTISQIGYMFLALGVGAFSAGMFHFMTHAFFKALLFLAAGAIIVALHHEQDVHKMGGLYKKLPLTFWTFTIGAAALAGFPFITSGFYSKDLILWYAYSSPIGDVGLWRLGMLGAFMTGLYSFRLVFLVFFGKEKTHVHTKPGWRISLPLVILATLALIGGFVELPHSIAHINLFSHFMDHALPASVSHGDAKTEHSLQLIAVATAFMGLFFSWLFFMPGRAFVNRLTATFPGGLLHRWWLKGWGFDWVYDVLFVQPLILFAKVNKDDAVDLIYKGLAGLARFFHALFSITQTGRVRWYAAGVAAGTAIILALAVYL